MLQQNSSTAAEVSRLTRRLIQNLQCCDRSLVACCQVTAEQAYTLAALEELGEPTMRELAEHMRLHGTTMTRMIDSLVAKGMVERRSDTEDRRIVRVGLSPRGAATAQDFERSTQEFLTEALQQLTPEERQAMLSGLRRLTDLAEALGGSCCQA